MNWKSCKYLTEFFAKNFENISYKLGVFKIYLNCLEIQM